MVTLDNSLSYLKLYLLPSCYRGYTGSFEGKCIVHLSLQCALMSNPTSDSPGTTYLEKLDYTGLISVLKMATMYADLLGRRWVKRKLEKADLSPTCRLVLACEHKIPDWIESAVRQIFHTPISSITVDEFFQLKEAYYYVSSGVSRVELHRKSVALRPPSLSGVAALFCANHDHCMRQWKSMWIKKVAPIILHPQIVPLASVRDKIPAICMDLAEPLAINEACREAAIKYITTKSVVFDFEDAVIKETANFIKSAFAAQTDSEELWENYGGAMDKAVELVPSGSGAIIIE